MPRQWVKEELRHDPLRNFVEKAIPYIQSHKETVIATVAGVIIIIAITLLTANRMKKASLLADEQVGFAAMYLRAGYVDQTIQLCDQIIQTHPAGIQGGYANFYKAEALYLKKNYAEAVKHYQNALPLLRKKEDMGAMIIFGIGVAQEAAAKYQEAIAAYKQLTDEYSAHYLVAEAQLGLARCYEASGDVQSAITYYQTVGSLHPTTIYKNISDARLSVLTGTPQQPPLANPK
ncbi:MAG: tetratricopeptide repeat protein [Elusimicrobiota bacterium]|nr:tetratricopeptide repeat protein [Elusimicrobiota bacterium]